MSAYDPHDPTTSLPHQPTTPQEVMPQLWHSRSWPLDLFGSHPGGPIWISPGNLWFNIPVFQMPLTMMYLCPRLMIIWWYFHGSNATTRKCNLNKLRNHIGISSMKPNLNSVWGLRDVPFRIYLLRASKCKYLYIYIVYNGFDNEA